MEATHTFNIGVNTMPSSRGLSDEEEAAQRRADQLIYEARREFWSSDRSTSEKERKAKDRLSEVYNKNIKDSSYQPW